MPPRISPIGIPRRHYALRQSCPTCARKSFTSAQLARSHILVAPREGGDAKTASQTHGNPRHQLRDALADLQKVAGSYVNLSRLHLALRGLDQSPGRETIRIAILGLADGGTSLKKAKKLLRTLIVDPLSEKEEEWERILLSDQVGRKPLLFKIGSTGTEDVRSNNILRELQVSSPMLNGNNLEILILETDLPSNDTTEDDASFASTVLVPTMDIPTSNTGRYTPIRTPVHKSLVVADGLRGAAALLAHPTDVNRDIIETAVDFPASLRDSESQNNDSLTPPFQALDINMADEAVQSLRESVDNALKYEHGWYDSNVVKISKWLTDGTSPTESGMKEPLRHLIESILNNANTSIQSEHARQLSVALSAKVSSKSIAELQQALARWGESSHTELRDQLDIAFHGKRWRKLGWWKLFWRVDDVSMITSDILNQRFLTKAEKDVIFMSGRLLGANVLKFNKVTAAPDENWAWQAVEDSKPMSRFVKPPMTVKDLHGIPSDDILLDSTPKPWPTDIHNARAGLLLKSVPALQALAQKLVLQTFSTASLASALAGLMYVSSLSTTIYEAGGVAALGVVWSLRRMQNAWETARTFWEGEVREEGRKAVRGTEMAFQATLEQSDDPLEGADELEAAQKAVRKAEELLEDACR